MDDSHKLIISICLAVVVVSIYLSALTDYFLGTFNNKIYRVLLRIALFISLAIILIRFTSVLYWLGFLGGLVINIWFTAKARKLC